LHISLTSSAFSSLSFSTEPLSDLDYEECPEEIWLVSVESVVD